MAKAVIHAGQLGAGQAAKICNNMILGATMVATCEAFVLAQKLGLDPQVFFDISSKASGQSWSMTSYAPVPGVGPDTPADHDYEGGFAAALMLKDLRLAAEAARSVGAYTPMGGEAEELYQRFVDRGGGSKDFSGIIKMIDDSWKVPDGAIGVSMRIRPFLPLSRPVLATQCSASASSRQLPKDTSALVGHARTRHEGMERSARPIRRSPRAEAADRPTSRRVRAYGGEDRQAVAPGRPDGSLQGTGPGGRQDRCEAGDLAESRGFRRQDSATFRRPRRPSMQPLQRAMI